VKSVLPLVVGGTLSKSFHWILREPSSHIHISTVLKQIDYYFVANFSSAASHKSILSIQVSFIWPLFKVQLSTGGAQPVVEMMQLTEHLLANITLDLIFQCFRTFFFNLYNWLILLGLLYGKHFLLMLLQSLSDLVIHDRHLLPPLSRHSSIIQQFSVVVQSFVPLLFLSPHFVFELLLGFSSLLLRSLVLSSW
jgi:hypothetical protein